MAAGLFFPQKRALGLHADESLSPELLEKVTCLGTVLSSFPQAHEATERLLDRMLGIKRIERLTERIGRERVAQRDAETAAFTALPLSAKLVAPSGVRAPQVAAVFVDGGQLQLCEPNEACDSHWHEYKAACLKDMDSPRSVDDPCPVLPALFLQRARIARLTRDIGQRAAETPPAEPAEADSGAGLPSPAFTADGGVYLPPQVRSSDVLATRRSCREFGLMLQARAWSLGMLASPRRALVGDGSSWIQGIWERHFRAYGFVRVLDIIHAVTYVFAAAMAGRPTAAGWPVYVRWITWVWQGEVGHVIRELAARQEELGPPDASDGPTSPRQIVRSARTYLENHAGQMNYPEYRRQGLPISSSHIESTVKLLNHRVKGTEKFWSESGAEALLQLKADTLSDTGHWDRFWHTRPQTMTGHRHYCRSTT